MKYTSLYINGNCIEIDNSIFGKEQIKVNGEILSSKYTILGGTHNFKYNDDQYLFNIKFGWSGVVLDLYLNGQPIIESPKSYALILLLFFLASDFLYRIIFE